MLLSIAMAIIEFNKKLNKYLSIESWNTSTLLSERQMSDKMELILSQISDLKVDINLIKAKSQITQS